jgi:hypothetical protein
MHDQNIVSGHFSPSEDLLKVLGAAESLLT